MRQAWGDGLLPLMEHATAADSRKHTDSLEAPRHYLDLDDLLRDSIHVRGQPWPLAASRLSGIDSTRSARHYGVLPWELEQAYHRLVRALILSDSSDVHRTRALRAAADLGHYLADAHVPLHSSGNYDGQRTNQRGIHALWETHAVEWMILRERRTCPPCSPESLPRYDPVWSPWEVLMESHAMLPSVFEAHTTWDSLNGSGGLAFQRRGRTMHLSPLPESLATWDSLTGFSTWPRYCLTAQRIASAWHEAWQEAGEPVLHSSSKRSIWDKLASYLPER